jgi:hypothetical protein
MMVEHGQDSKPYCDIFNIVPLTGIYVVYDEAGEFLMTLELESVRKIVDMGRFTKYPTSGWLRW